MRRATTTCDEEEEEEGAAFGGRVGRHCSCVSSDSMRVQCESVERVKALWAVCVVIVVVARCVWERRCEPDGRPQQPMPVSKKGKGEEGKSAEAEAEESQTKRGGWRGSK